ncbi:hypothetical protein [Streptomyces sp. NPDC102415]|uniref:hypothetical protein n=1 Tax=unclassified Streptomyces TaxID=2593676 RepID=UPI0038156252
MPASRVRAPGLLLTPTATHRSGRRRSTAHHPTAHHPTAHHPTTHGSTATRSPDASQEGSFACTACGHPRS